MTSNYQAASQANNYFELGNQAYGRGNREEAKQFYLKCLQLAPNFIHAQYNLGVVCTELEQWQEASFYLRQAIATKPDHAHAYNYLGYSDLRMGRV
jgi:tetratricopeptide (TPR) repeat protein